jgi:uncharacterized protein (TIGR03067 family)
MKRFWHWLRHGSGFGVDELARRLGTAPADLLALTPSYRELTVPKRSGGQRRLCVPDDVLKAVQRQILHRLLRRLKVHPAATGFRRGQSIVTHARRHVGQAVVVRLDVQDFFPSTTAGRVYAYFRAIGWNRPAARRLTELCTYRGGLPQGAPSSPCLSNLLNYRIDSRLTAMAAKLGASYSRYADDITLSFPSTERKPIHYLIRFVRRVMHEAGYQLHGAKKLSIRGQHQQQRVTGLVVNDRVQLPRAVRRRLRAVAHYLHKGRPATLTAEQLAGWQALEQMIAAQAFEPRHAERHRKERDNLQGTWSIVAAERQGQPVPAEEFAQCFAGLRWIIGPERLVLAQGDERVEATYRLDPFQEPRAIDLTPTQGPQRGRRVLGIYDLGPTRLRVCMNHGKGKRPSEFVTPPDAPWTLLVLTRSGQSMLESIVAVRPKR